MLQINHEMGPEICVTFAADGCPKQFHVVQKTVQKNDRLTQREDKSDSETGESLASTLRLPAAPPYKQKEPS